MNFRSPCRPAPDQERRPCFVRARVRDVADNPRLLIIDREASQGKFTLEKLGEVFDVVTVHSISKALSLLRDSQFSGVYVDASQLAAVRWVGMIIQAEEILDAIADGVAVVDPDLRVIWANPEFLSLTDSQSQVTGCNFYQVLPESDVLGPDPCPFTSAVASRGPHSTVIKIRGGRYLRVTVTPVFDATHTLTHLIALTREITDETQQQLKVTRDRPGRRRAGRPYPGGALPAWSRGAHRSAQVQHRPPHEGPYGS